MLPTNLSELESRGGVRDADRRDAGRVKTHGIRSNVGEILDASSSGLRIKGKLPAGTRPGSHINVEIANEADSVDLRCEVRWIQKHPFRGSTFGVCFVDPTDEQRQRLWSVVRSGQIETYCSTLRAA